MTLDEFKTLKHGSPVVFNGLDDRGETQESRGTVSVPQTFNVFRVIHWNDQTTTIVRIDDDLTEWLEDSRNA